MYKHTILVRFAFSGGAKAGKLPTGEQEKVLCPSQACCVCVDDAGVSCSSNFPVLIALSLVEMLPLM